MKQWTGMDDKNRSQCKMKQWTGMDDKNRSQLHTIIDLLVTIQISNTNIDLQFIT